MPHDSTTRVNGVSISGGSVVVGSVMSFTNLGRAHGRIVVDGVDVTDVVRASRPEPLTVRARLPQGSSLMARLTAGNIAAQGALARAQLDTTSADAEIQAAQSVQARSVSGDISVGVCGGPADLSATSGDIEIEDARGAVRAASTSGDVRVHVTQSVHVDARTISGNVRVTAPAGVRPQVSGHSISGRVRTP
jgi:Putative adhesin